MFAERQAGFMKGRSFTTALVEVIKVIRSQLDKKI